MQVFKPEKRRAHVLPLFLGAPFMKVVEESIF
jgi:hypothetical protein